MTIRFWYEMEAALIELVKALTKYIKERTLEP